MQGVTAGLTGAAAGVLVAALSAWWDQSRLERALDVERDDLERIRDIAEERGADDPVLRTEQLSRSAQFLGEAGHGKVEGSFVVIVGLGGVGSHAASMLARAGVGRLRLVDFDVVTLSSLNRHAVATRGDVGSPKVASMRRHLGRVAPWCKVEAIPEMFTASAAERLLEGSPDLVLDCIDDSDTKAALVLACLDRGLRLLCSLGAGGKCDPTKLCIAPLAVCGRDRLAHKVRLLVRQARGDDVADDTPCVFSEETARRGLLPLSDEQMKDPEAFGAVPGFRLRVLPVLGPMPALFGDAMAAWTLCELSGSPIEAPYDSSCPRGGYSKQTSRLLATAQHREKTLFANADFAKEPDLAMDVFDDLTNVVWQRRCAATGTRLGIPKVKFVITRWDVAQPPHRYNLVLLTEKAAKTLQDKGQDAFDHDVRHYIEATINTARARDRIALGQIAPNTPPQNQLPSTITLILLGVSSFLAGYLVAKTKRK